MHFDRFSNINYLNGKKEKKAKLSEGIIWVTKDLS